MSDKEAVMEIVRKLPKEAVMEIVRKLPDDATLDEIIDEIQILVAIRRGKKDIAEGRFLTHEDAKERLEQWLTK